MVCAHSFDVIHIFNCYFNLHQTEIFILLNFEAGFVQDRGDAPITY